MFHKVRLNCSIHLFFDLSVSEKLKRNIFSDFSSSFDPDRWLLAFLCTRGGGGGPRYHGGACAICLCPQVFTVRLNFLMSPTSDRCCSDREWGLTCVLRLASDVYCVLQSGNQVNAPLFRSPELKNNINKLEGNANF